MFTIDYWSGENFFFIAEKGDAGIGFGYTVLGRVVKYIVFSTFCERSYIFFVKGKIDLVEAKYRSMRKYYY